MFDLALGASPGVRAPLGLRGSALGEPRGSPSLGDRRLCSAGRLGLGMSGTARAPVAPTGSRPRMGPWYGARKERPGAPRSPRGARGYTTRHSRSQRPLGRLSRRGEPLSQARGELRQLAERHAPCRCAGLLGRASPRLSAPSSPPGDSKLPPHQRTPASGLLEPRAGLVALADGLTPYSLRRGAEYTAPSRVSLPAK